MQINTRVFGTIEIDEDKVIVFEDGILGFGEYHRYALAFDSEDSAKKSIMWLQCIDEPTLAFPVIDPMCIMADYNPVVEDEWLKGIGEFESEADLLVLNILTVPSDLTQITANMAAPIVINSATKKACQIIANNADYDVHYNVYEVIQKMKEGSQC